MKLARLSNDEPEVFYSIQGEGKSIGLPSVFVRFSICNLHCIWCDADYTWNWVGTKFEHVRDREFGYQKYEKSRQIIELSPEEVAELVGRYDCRNVIFTGGEPMLHQNDCVALMRFLREQNSKYRFEIETNGTKLPNDPVNSLVSQYNVSLKLENSGVPRRLRENPQAIDFFAGHKSAYFKFVVEGNDDLIEIENLITNYQICNSNVILMPEGTKSETVRNRSLELIETCKRKGYRFSDRLHIHIYGDKRGT